MPDVKIERKDIIVETPILESTDTSSGSGLRQSKIVKRVIISSESSRDTKGLYHINKRLNREYTATGNSS